MKLTIHGFVVLALAACTPSHVAAPLPPANQIDTDRGPILGGQHDGVREFLGIPFAAPPVGALRWKPPAPAITWSATRDATHRRHACTQPERGFARDTNEDCLTLDVWVPVVEDKHLPVLVWIHGGAFVQGSGDDDFNDGARLAARARAIVVTVNYRLGPLGFLSSRELAREAGTPVAPSVGLLDQRAAFAWVQRNIAAFGGDPSAVTIFGNSAGAWSVCAHLASPGSRGLFAGAIMESGACSDALYFDPAAATAQADQLAAAVGCTENVLDCMRGKSADTIAAALPWRRGFVLEPGVWWGPVVDGNVLPQRPLDVMRAGRSAPVPLVIGWNQDEGILHTISFDAVTVDELAGWVRGVFGSAAVERIAARYTRPTPKDALTDVITDGVFACNARRVARVLTQHHIPVYAYEWTHALDNPKAHVLGATHSVELFFVWGNPGGGIELSGRELPLSYAMMAAWGRFARTRDPGDFRVEAVLGADATAHWPVYSLANEEALVLDLRPSIATHQKAEICDFWDDLDTHRE